MFRTDIANSHYFVLVYFHICFRHLFHHMFPSMMTMAFMQFYVRSQYALSSELICLQLPTLSILLKIFEANLFQGSYETIESYFFKEIIKCWGLNLSYFKISGRRRHVLLTHLDRSVFFAQGMNVTG